MVDTPRTLAEVKTLLADNTSGQISAQDMRDLVESIVDPVPGGGFDNPIELIATTMSNNSYAISSAGLLSWYEVVSDTHGFVSGSPPHTDIVIPAGCGGDYEIMAQCDWDASATGIRRSLMVNSDAEIQLFAGPEIQVPNMASVSAYVTVSGLIPGLRPGDGIYIQSHHDGGGTITVAGCSLILRRTRVRG